MNRILLVNLTVIILLILLASCSQPPPPPQKVTYSTDVDSLQALLDYKEAYIDSLYNIIEYLTYQVDSLMVEFEVTSSKILLNNDFMLPYRFNFAGVDIDLTNDRIRSRLQQIFDTEVKSAHIYIPRSGTYFALIDSIITSHNLHPDVKYLAVAESYLNYMAYSPANAAGIWQFIPSTAKSFNLKVDSYLDERRNIFKATDAACRYLKQANQDLRNMGVNDFLITMASYNSGMGNIARTIREQNAKDFFSLIMRVEETNNYVWRAIAIKLIFENESKIFDRPFTRMQPLLETTTIKTINTNGYYDLVEWAIAQGTNVQRVWELNPWLNISRTRSGRRAQINNLIIPPGNFEILIPIDSQADTTKVAQAEEKFLKKNNSPYILGASNEYKVKSGDTIYGLARRFGVSENDIRRWNGLSSNRIYVGQTLHFQAQQSSTTTTNSTSPDAATVLNKGQYRVVSGDTLSQIAEKLGVTTAHLAAKNNIRPTTTIYPGQILDY